MKGVFDDGLQEKKDFLCFYQLYMSDQVDSFVIEDFLQASLPFTNFRPHLNRKAYHIIHSTRTFLQHLLGRNSGRFYVWCFLSPKYCKFAVKCNRNSKVFPLKITIIWVFLEEKWSFSRNSIFFTFRKAGQKRCRHRLNWHFLWENVLFAHILKFFCGRSSVFQFSKKIGNFLMNKWTSEKKMFWTF